MEGFFPNYAWNQFVTATKTLKEHIVPIQESLLKQCIKHVSRCVSKLESFLVDETKFAQEM